MTRKHLVFLVFLILLVALATRVVGAVDFSKTGSDLESPDTQMIRQTGRLFTIEFSAGKHIQIKAAGTNVLQYSPEQISVFGRSLAAGGTGENLSFVRENGRSSSAVSFRLTQPLPPGAKIELEVKELQGGASEKFILKTK
jgi:hypothetical protein